MEYSQAQTSGNHKAIFGSILIIWGVAVAVGLPIMFGLNDRYGIFLIFFFKTQNWKKIFFFRETNISEDEVTCEFHNPDFIICSSVLSFYIPCIIIIFIYASVYRVSSNKLFFISYVTEIFL